MEAYRTFTPMVTGSSPVSVTIVWNDGRVVKRQRRLVVLSFLHRLSLCAILRQRRCEMKLAKQNEARRLRAQGASVRQIALALGVSKSSVSRWVRGIELSDAQECRLWENCREGQRKGLKNARKAKKEQAEQRRAVYRDDGFQLAASDEAFRIICSIYWGEGTKSKNVFEVTNGDISMLLVVGRWLVTAGYGGRLRLRGQFYPTDNIDAGFLRDWLLDKLRFLGPGDIKTLRPVERVGGRGRGPLRHPHGIHCLYVCDTGLVQMVMGGIDYLKGKWCEGLGP